MSFKSALQSRVEASWQKPNLLTVLLAPLSLVYGVLFWLRATFYRIGVFKRYKANVPVIVVGNLTVGGTGKTPLTIYLIEELRRLGYSPGVISRGYGGQAEQYPLAVTLDTPVNQSGDEPALIVKRTRVPMVVGADRQACIERLLADNDVDVIVSDDGLQHLKLVRDIEICLLDATSPNRNPMLFPAGPYRESKRRLRSVDLVVCHGQQGDTELRFAMNLRASSPQPVAPTSAGETGSKNKGVFNPDQIIQAVAGIGNPQRFFDTCSNLGLAYKPHRFPDHHVYRAEDIDLPGPVLMTEKDAIKCTAFADQRHWYLPVDAKLSDDFTNALGILLKQLN